MARLDVPLCIAEAPTDRLRVSVEISGDLRLIPGARAPTIGQAAGEGAVRTPGQYLLGKNVQEDQQTTVQIVQRALPGTQVFDFLDQAARDNDEIDLDFRAFGSLMKVVTTMTKADEHFEIIAADSTGMSEVQIGSIADLTIGGGSEADLFPGIVLYHVKTGTTKDSGNEDFIEHHGTASDPEFVVISDVFYDSSGASPKAYTKTILTAAGFPNDSSTVATGVVGDVAIAHPSVKWTAVGNATSFQPGFGEDSALYTLDVTLTEVMPRAEVIHPADVNIGNTLPTP